MDSPLTRREFLGRSAALAASGLTAASVGGGCATHRASRTRPQIMTVLGPIRTRELGATLPHEHIFLDFIGAEGVSRDRYDRDEVFRTALPHLTLLKDFGCQSMAECTPAYIGRDPLLLKRLAEESELQILTNTGYYGASNNLYLPRHAWTETADELAARWMAEWRDGIEDTGIRPGFIKIGVDKGPLSDLHRKLVRAAARTHLATGLTIAAHTGDGAAAMDELETLHEEGVRLSAFIWVHAQNEKNMDLHVRAASLGCWVEFDHVSHQTLAQHLDLVKMMKARGWLHRTLVSHDAGWYQAGKPGGGEYRPYDTLFTEFLPKLKEEGFTQADMQQLLVTNPAEAFTIRVRSDHETQESSEAGGPPRPTRVSLM